MYAIETGTGEGREENRRGIGDIDGRKYARGKGVGYYITETQSWTSLWLFLMMIKLKNYLNYF